MFRYMAGMHTSGGTHVCRAGGPFSRQGELPTPQPLPAGPHLCGPAWLHDAVTCPPSLIQREPCLLSEPQLPIYTMAGWRKGLEPAHCRGPFAPQLLSEQGGKLRPRDRRTWSKGTEPTLCGSPCLSAPVSSEVK